jgi:hypothetical protein
VYRRVSGPLRSSRARLRRPEPLSALTAARVGVPRLRELIRYRTSPIRERAAEINRLAKVLKGAKIKLGSVST